MTGSSRTSSNEEFRYSYSFTEFLQNYADACDEFNVVFD